MTTKSSTQDRPLRFEDCNDEQRAFETCRRSDPRKDPLLRELLDEIDDSYEVDLTGSDSDGEVIVIPDAATVAGVVPAPKPTSRTLLPKKSGAISLPVAHYVFEAGENRAAFMLMSDEELDSAHTSICERTYSRSASPLSYMAVRGDYCAASIVMNERGLHPTRFRSACKGAAWKRGMVWDDDMKTMSKDMSVIDLHCLHCSGVRSQVKDYEFRDLLATDHFDFELAAGFVATKWKTESRVGKLLVLSDVEQWQVKKLASASIQASWKKVFSEAPAVEQRLKSAAHRRPHLAPHVQDYTRLWIADAICEDGNQRLIGIVHGWQNGALPLAPSTLSAKLKTMRRWTKAD